MVVFMLVAKGWSLTRENIGANEWRCMIITMSAFYMANSILLVLQSTVLSAQGFWIGVGLLYVLMYFYIVSSAESQLSAILGYVGLFQPDMPPLVTDPLKEKRFMYVAFLALMAVSMATEVALHALVEDVRSIAVSLSIYEISNVLILLAVGWLFRPREYSPFFFMVPAQFTENGTR